MRYTVVRTGPNRMLALGRDIEKRVLARAVKAHAADEIMVYKNRTIVFG